MHALQQPAGVPLRAKLPEQPGPCAAPLSCLRLSRRRLPQVHQQQTVRCHISTASSSAQQANPGCQKRSPATRIRRAAAPRACACARARPRPQAPGLGAASPGRPAGPRGKSQLLHPPCTSARLAAGPAGARSGRRGAWSRAPWRGCRGTPPWAGRCVRRTPRAQPPRSNPGRAVNSPCLACACADALCAPLGCSRWFPAHADAGTPWRHNRACNAGTRHTASQGAVRTSDIDCHLRSKAHTMGWRRSVH